MDYAVPPRRQKKRTETKGVLSVDTLSIGGLTTTATFGEMTTRSLDGCSTMDGIMGMGVPNAAKEQSVFEDLVEVREGWTVTISHGAIGCAHPIV